MTPSDQVDASVSGVTSRPDVSVVIPCLNEIESIANCVRDALTGLRTAEVRGEVVVADNGSTDGSIQEAERAGARIVHVPARGYGSAVQGGIAVATGEIVVLGDADGQHDFTSIPSFIQLINSGFALVVGNRFSGKIQPGSMSWSHRYIGNPLLSGLLRLLFHPGIHDAQCGMRALTRSAYSRMDLRTTGFELCPEMVIKGARLHLPMTEIPITVRSDLRDRPPHLKTLPDGWRHLSFILMCAPNWLFIAPGLLLLCTGVAFVSWLYSGTQRIGGIGLDTRAQLFGAILASLGLQIASIGLFARVFSYSEPLRTHSRSLGRALSRMRLEVGLAFGGLLVAVGLAGDIFEYARWASHGFGILKHDRAIVFWSTWLLLGIQIGFSSFFLSMIGISRGTWIGDRS